MNMMNHFLFALSLGLLLFRDFLPTPMIVILTLVFSVFIDVDQVIIYFKNNKKDNGHLRSWVQEPMGFFLVFVPLAWVLSFANPYYFPLVIMTVASHIFLDYLTHHHVRPMAPFKTKNFKIGFIKAYPAKKWADSQLRGFSENYVLVANIFLFLLIAL